MPYSIVSLENRLETLQEALEATEHDLEESTKAALKLAEILVDIVNIEYLEQTLTVDDLEVLHAYI